MSTFAITVIADGNDCGTYEVEAEDEWKARGHAMAAMLRANDAGRASGFTSGAAVEYVVA